MRAINLILLILGTTLLAALVFSIGAGELWSELCSLGWGLIPFLLVEGIAEMIHTLGWRHCLPENARSMSWFKLFQIRLAGYAINYLTPTAALGGEVTKATLLASKCRGREAVSGVLIGKACFGLAHLIFVAIGTLIIMRSIRLPAAIWMPLLFSGLLIGGGVFSFILLQKYGKLGSLIRWLTARGVGGRALEKVGAQLTAVDEEMRAFYRKQPWDMCLAIFWHLAGYSAGILQTWLFLHLVHPPASLSVAASIWFLGMWFDLLTFAIPMNIGALEGSRVLSLKLFGFSPALGLAYGVALRSAQILWAAVGLVFYSVLTMRKSGQAAKHLTVPPEEDPANHQQSAPQRPSSSLRTRAGLTGLEARQRTNFKPDGHDNKAGPNGHYSKSTSEYDRAWSPGKCKENKITE
jgi:uncharacterized protein (TIRG00374 family)